MTPETSAGIRSPIQSLFAHLACHRMARTFCNLVLHIAATTTYMAGNVILWVR